MAATCMFFVKKYIITTIIGSDQKNIFHLLILCIRVLSILYKNTNKTPTITKAIILIIKLLVHYMFFGINCNQIINGGKQGESQS